MPEICDMLECHQIPRASSVSACMAWNLGAVISRPLNTRPHNTTSLHTTQHDELISQRKLMHLVREAIRGDRSTSPSSHETPINPLLLRIADFMVCVPSYSREGVEVGGLAETLPTSSFAQDPRS